MKRLKRIFAITMTLLLISTLANATGFETINGLKYLIDTEKNEATLVANSPKYSGDIIVPERITSSDKDYPVTSLGSGCFFGCPELTSITIPSSVKSLGDNCFYGLGLTSITLPSSVTSLGNYCFFGCTELTSIIIPSSVTSLGDYCFAGCWKLTSMNIPSSVTSLGESCFDTCVGLTSISIPSSITSLKHSCFSGCSSLTSINIPSSVTSLGATCFSGCSGLTSITLPSSVTSIEDCCFENCSGLTSIIIPPSVTSLRGKCFFGCSGLTSITLPSSVTYLGDYCFNNCTGLTSIDIPSSVTSLGYGCFSNCSNLTSINCYATMPPTGQDSFSQFNTSTCLLTVPQASIDKYKSADGWKSFPYILVLEGSEPGSETTKCDVPSITFTDGKLHFSSATQGAQYHYTITDKDMANGTYSQSGEVVLSAAYEISAYATADGHITSDSAKATLYWLPTSEVNNINNTSSRGIVTTCNNGIITISGLNAQENVTFYTVNGEQFGTAAAIDGVATYAVNATYDIVIAKFGDSSIKIVTK